jgi:uncharacterized membrane protein YidH (DUF202 family)
MVREDGPKRAGENWKREDIESSDYPFSMLSTGEVERFPHAILEVKLQTHVGQGPPKWAEALVASHLVEEVPKFSKYIHGCATLFSNAVSIIPFWLPQMSIDIRKPVPAELGDDSDDGGQGGSSEEISSTGKLTESARHSGSDSKLLASPRTLEHLIIPITVDGEDDSEESPLIGKQKVGGSAGILGFFTGQAKVAPSSGAGLVETSGQTPDDKRIHVPVRVEPKVFFANERTFLSWVHFSIFLGGIATALVGLGNWNAKASGFLFGGVSVMFACYALYLYQWRAARIRARDPGPYDDRVGPVVVVFVFLAAMIANMVFSVLRK